jgi:broad specificity phosphatase PhoE
MNDFINISRQFITNRTKTKLILIRSCENIGSLSGCISGWLDVKLSDYGRKQAKHLSLEYFIHLKNFQNVHTSDLTRSKNTAEICLAYDDNIKLITSKNLREVYYGKQEGLFFDGLSKEEKAQINKQDYKFEDGESWLDVKFRALRFMIEVEKNDLNLIFTHGGFIANLLYSSGVKQILPSGSIVFLTLNDYNIETLKQLGESYENDKWDKDHIKLFELYNESVLKALKATICNVDYIYKLPDLSDII